MRQHRRSGQRRLGALALITGAALAGCGLAPAQAGADPEAQPAAQSEARTQASDWPSLQDLLNLPDWMQLQLSVTAEPLFNPAGGRRSSGSWIQQGTLDLDLSTGLNKPTSSWREIDHWQLSVSVNHDAGYASYNNAIGALFPLQQVAYPAGFYLSALTLERQRGNGWLSVKAGVLPINPDFVEVPVLNNYVHSAFNNTLNISIADLPINPYAALGTVVTAHASPELSLRYGVFDLSSTDPISRWLGLSEGGVGPDTGTAQFLQLNLEPASLAAQPIQACRSERGIVPWRQQGSGCQTPVIIPSQLPGGLLSLGGYSTTLNGEGVYGSVTLPSGLPIGLDHRMWIGAAYSPDAGLDLSPTFVGGGLVVQGPLPSRPLDVMVLGIGRGGLSPQLARSTYEGMLELGYRVQVNQHLNLQPTLQWIVNPSGADHPVPGIFAAGVQIQLNF